MTKFKDLKTGSILGESQYYRVVKISGAKVQLNNGEGDIVVDKKYVENYLHSADQFDSIETLTKTGLADLFINSPRLAMTVAFNKQDKPKTKKAYNAEIEQQAQDIASGKITVKDALMNPVLNYTPGELRVMRGRHYGEIDDLGRIQFHDMDVESGAPMRLVDPRTIQYLVVNGIKYTLK